MTLDECRKLAAQAWCKEKTSAKIMDPTLAEEFALIMFDTVKDILDNVKQIKKR